VGHGTPVGPRFLAPLAFGRPLQGLISARVWAWLPAAAQNVLIIVTKILGCGLVCCPLARTMRKPKMGLCNFTVKTKKSS
jgi:hypothetical protein